MLLDWTVIQTADDPRISVVKEALAGSQRGTIDLQRLFAYGQSVAPAKIDGSKPLRRYIDTRKLLPDQARELVDKAWRDGWLGELVDWLKAYRGASPYVRQLDRLAQAAPALFGSQPPDAAGGKATPFEPTASFLDKIAHIMDATCLIAAPGGEPLGTGLLVGDDLVLTCCHVVKDKVAVDASGAVSAVGTCDYVCNFGFHDNGADMFVPFAKTDWLAAASPPASDRRDPAKSLDIALVRLSWPAHVRRDRKPISMVPAPGQAADAIVLVVQHPCGHQSSSSVGRLLEMRQYDAVAYSAATCVGSSGGGVFLLPGCGFLALHMGKDGQAMATQIDQVNVGRVATAVNAVINVPPAPRPSPPVQPG